MNVRTDPYPSSLNVDHAKLFYLLGRENTRIFEYSVLFGKSGVPHKLKIPKFDLSDTTDLSAKN